MALRIWKTLRRIHAWSFLLSSWPMLSASLTAAEAIARVEGKPFDWRAQLVAWHPLLREIL